MRITVVSLFAVAVTIGTMSVSAQTPPAAGKVLSAAVQKEWASARRNLAESAELMPAENYGFKPVGTAADIRTFGAILSHVAGASYIYCAAAKGVEAPHGEGDFEKSATTRPAIIKALNDALTYCDQTYSAYNDAQLSEMGNAAFSTGKAPRIAALLGNISHLNEHYGNLVTYFRAKGIVPPSSRRGGN